MIRVIPIIVALLQLLTFGTPLTYFNPREVQLAARYSF